MPRVIFLRGIFYIDFGCKRYVFYAWELLICDMSQVNEGKRAYNGERCQLHGRGVVMVLSI